MTREEAIEILWRYDVNFEPHPPEEVMHAIDMAIEALEGKDTNVPTKDCISRQDATTLPFLPKEHREYQTNNLDDAFEYGWMELTKCIELLPSADRLAGEWIEHEWAEEVEGLLISNYECSECHGWERSASNFCPNCGAKMGGTE